MKRVMLSTATPGPSAPSPATLRTWARRIGVGGLIFFAAKGLLWLAIPVLIAWLS